MVAKKATAKKAPARKAAAPRDSGLAGRVATLERAVRALSQGNLEAAQDTMGSRL